MTRRGYRTVFDRAAFVFTSALAWVALACGAASGQQPLVPPEMAGFPLTIAGGGATAYSQPAIADLGLDGGRKSIVYTNRRGQLVVLLASGAIATGFPQKLPAPIESSPAVADLDGDGSPEIVVGFGSATAPTRHGGIRAYRRDGTLLWARRTRDFDVNGYRDAVFSTPAVGDVDGDGALEVAYASFDARVYLVDAATGANRPQWPRFVRDTVWSSPALHDLDGDGKLEVVVGADAHLEEAVYHTPDGGCLHAFRFDGSELNGFPVCIDQVIVSSPSVGDVDGDGSPDIVVGTGVYYPGRAHALYALRSDGTPLPGWPVTVDGQVSTSPALADLDGDGGLEVIATSDASGSSGEHHVDAFRADGTRLFSSLAPKNFFGSTLGAGELVVADVTGDAEPEILFPTNTEVCVVARTGEQLSDDGSHTGAFSLYTETALGNVVVDDLGGDGIPEVIAVSAAPFPSATDTVIHVWQPLTRTAAPAPWGAFRAGAERRGSAPGTSAGSGSRYVDADLYLRQLFLDFLGREPAAGEAQAWVDEIDAVLATRAEVGLEFLERDEFRRARATIARYFLGLLGRRPTWSELESWSARLEAAGCSGATCSETERQAIVDALMLMPKFVARFPQDTSADRYVTLLYKKILGRTPDPTDVSGWAAELTSGRRTRAELARIFVESPEYVNDRSPWPVLVVLAWAGFLHTSPDATDFAVWRDDLTLGRPPAELVQELITSDAYLARFP